MDENNNEHIGGIAINVGNPHVIFFVESIDNFNIKKIGPTIENNKLFPEKCNVTIAEVINQNLIKVKVWERGTGQTKACGTAACATAVAGNINGFTKAITDIEFELGKLSIFLDEKNNVHMKGPVSEIKEMADLNKTEIYIFASLVFLTLFFGIYPEPLFNTIDISVSNLIDNYQADLNFYLVQTNY